MGLSEIRKLLRKAKSMDEFRALIARSDTQLRDDVWIFYKCEADYDLKRRLGLSFQDKWHVFIVEAYREPINQWEKVSHLGQILISDDLEEIRVVGPQQ
jgi:hypothetical protein